MTTHSYALSRTGRVWLLSSVTLPVSATCFGFFIGRLAEVLLTTALKLYLLVLLMISLSTGFMACGAGHYAMRVSLQKPEPKENAND